MKVLLTGATGFVGTHLTERLHAAGHEVLPVSRREGARYDWSSESLARGVSEADAVVHLAGENLFAKRWSAKQKQVIWSSRYDATKKLAAFVAARKPACFVSASAVGYYGAHGDEKLDESSPHGQDFLADLCRDWESATEDAAEAGVRTAVVRTGVVLGQGGGALAKMLPPFKLGVGGPLGNGKQWVSWIHVDDLASLFVFLIEHPKAAGAFNGTAPQPVTMKELASALGRALHRPAVFAVPAPVLRIAVGEVADVLLTGQRVEPRRARELGFQFRFPDVDSALRDVVAKKPSSPQRPREAHAGA
jgi:uncharacterized protein (TIGR01777 family)